MTYHVDWTSAARRDLDRLPEKVVTAVVEFVYGPLAERPTIVGRPLTLELAGAYTARRGDHRIIYRIDHDERALLVVAVGHRSDVYRRR